MERKLDEDLKELKKKIFEMISLVNDLIEKSITALNKKDEKLADEIEEKDMEVDNYENEIDKFCLELLVRYQPAACDLRYITSIMKINNDVERIGDLATTIAHKAKIIAKEAVIDVPENIDEIYKIIKKMIINITAALDEINSEKAKDTCKIDKLIDEMYVETFRQIIDLIVKSKVSVKAGIELILSTKYLERIADHLTNIAEDIVYMAEGELIKHKKMPQMDKIKVLFVCSHNSARSQMAEAYLNYFGGDAFIVESAGLEPGILNPYVVEVMKEDGIDISGNKTKSVFDFYKEGRLYNYVITVCDKETAERCPVFPGQAIKLNWSFPDPTHFTGTEQEILQQIRKLRDEIKIKIKEFLTFSLDVKS